jgi:hypothetical protein
MGPCPLCTLAPMLWLATTVPDASLYRRSGRKHPPPAATKAQRTRSETFQHYVGPLRGGKFGGRAQGTLPSKICPLALILLLPRAWPDAALHQHSDI